MIGHYFFWGLIAEYHEDSVETLFDKVRPGNAKYWAPEVSEWAPEASEAWGCPSEVASHQSSA